MYWSLLRKAARFQALRYVDSQSDAKSGQACLLSRPRQSSRNFWLEPKNFATGRFEFASAVVAGKLVNDFEMLRVLIIQRMVPEVRQAFLKKFWAR